MGFLVVGLGVGLGLGLGLGMGGGRGGGMWRLDVQGEMCSVSRKR